jgi:hypothetical protein
MQNEHTVAQGAKRYFSQHKEKRVKEKFPFPDNNHGISNIILERKK